MELHQMQDGRMEAREEVGVGFKKENILTVQYSSSEEQFEYDQLNKHETKFALVTEL